MKKQDAEAVKKEKILQFVDLFAMQNWRHRQHKDDSQVEPITIEDVLMALKLFREEDLEEIVDDALKDKHAALKIAEAIAKSMLLDKYTFVKACKNFWFSAEKYEPLREKVKKLIPEMASREEAKQQIDEWDGMEIIRSRKPTGESMIEVEVEEGQEPVQVSIPDRLIDVAHLSGKQPFHEQKKPKRVGVNMRMRTDCSEILKLSAAASDMSVTQFVEQLALVHASSLVRSHTATFLQDDNHSDAAIAKNLYDTLSVRYDKAKAFFPKKIEDMRKQPIRNYRSGWFPESGDDFDRYPPHVGCRRDCLDFLQQMILNCLHFNVQNSKKMVTLHKFVDQIEMTDEETDDWKGVFEEFLSRYAEVVKAKPEGDK